MRLMGLAYHIILFLSVEAAYSMSTSEIAARAFSSVVMIVVNDKEDNPYSQGSGFFVEKNLIATNYHVIQSGHGGYAKRINREKAYKILGVVASSTEDDLALLQVEDSEALPLEINERKVSVGETIFAAGNPMGLEGVFSDGIVSSTDIRFGRNILGITAPISEGSSGGPVFDNDGKVVAVVVSTSKSGQNLNFAIPASRLKTLLFGERVLVALADINWDVEVYANASMALYLKGKDLVRKYSLEEAMALFTKIVEADPQFTLAYLGRASVYTLMLRYNEALSEFNRAIYLEPKNYYSYCLRSTVFLEINEYDNAIADADMAIDLAPYNSKCYSAKGLVLCRLGNGDLGLKYLNEAVQMNSDDPKPIALRGAGYNSLGNYREAIDDLNKAIEIDPEFLIVYRWRAHTNASRKQFDAAIKDLEYFLEKSPRDFAALRHLGFCYLQTRKYQQAIQLLDKAIEINSRDGRVYAIRAECYDKLGDRRSMQRDIKIAAKLGLPEARAYCQKNGINYLGD